MSIPRPSLCDGLHGEYSLGLHVGAIFVVLFSSIVGTGLPIVAKFLPFLRSNSLFFLLCKTAATGVLLSVSSIHLINDSVNDFLEPCLDKAFTQFYSGYAFLFAFTAALLMHAVDLQLAAVTEDWMKRRHVKAQQALEQGLPEKEDEMKAIKQDANAQEKGVGVKHERDRCQETPRNDSVHEGGATEPAKRNTVHLRQRLHGGHEDAQVTEHGEGVGDWSPSEQRECAEEPTSPTALLPTKRTTSSTVVTDKEPLDTAADAVADTACETTHPHDHHYHGHLLDDLDAAHGHSHTLVLPPPDMPKVRRVIAAICMEFGVSLHSIFVGLDVGLTTDHDLKPLLIALVFHQLFEGVSLGSRLVDAGFHVGMEVMLALVFSVSAPLGMVAATIAVSVKQDAMSGSSFVLMMAVLSSFCGGILLYLAFNLLFTDFATDIRAVGGPGHPWRRLAMFAALWAGFLIMAAVGKWL